MKLSYTERKTLEQNDILKRAADAGVQARKRGTSHVELDNDQFMRLVDQRERFADLLRNVLERSEENNVPSDVTITKDLRRDIREALAGR